MNRQYTHVTSYRFGSWDPFALIPGLLITLTAVGYIWLITQQGSQPVAWFIGSLMISALLSLYGSVTRSPGRTTTLAASCAILIVLGVLGIASIGFFLLAESVFVMLAAIRSRRAPS